LIVCAFSYSNASTAQAQTVVCGIVRSDSLDKQTFPITIYLNKALYGGLGAPNFGVVDSTVITKNNAVFSLFLPESGAYFLCFTGAQAPSLGIVPLLVDTGSLADSIYLRAHIVSGQIDVQALPPYSYIADMQRVHRAVLTAQMNANKQSSSPMRTSVQPSADSTLQASLFQTVVSEHIHPEARKFAAYCLLYGLDREKFEDHASRLETALSLLPPRSLHWSWGGQNAIVNKALKLLR
jgi:Na+-transporting methylmalonyl-CoA/oxaloacetate decarboxylase beta subunit